jgi:hypothetical protein
MSKLFITDYASYNDGTQFQFGHWVDLANFNDADEFQQYVIDHLKQADEDSPLLCETKREEPMYTDYEGFPESLYSESMSSKELKELFEYIALGQRQQHAYEYATTDLGYDHDIAIMNLDDICMWEIDSSKRRTIYHIFEELYPEAEQAEQLNQYLTIDYDQFKRDCLNEFTALDGTEYLVLNNN